MTLERYVFFGCACAAGFLVNRIYFGYKMFVDTAWIGLPEFAFRAGLATLMILIAWPIYLVATMMALTYSYFRGL